MAEQYALVIGVGSYQRGQAIPRLQYAGEDASQLASALEKVGYQVTLMAKPASKVYGGSNTAPTAAAIREKLREVSRLATNDEDILLVAFIGQTAQLEYTSPTSTEQRCYICPADAKLAKLQRANDVTELDNLIDVRDVYLELESCVAGAKLLVLDTCRGSGRGLTRSAVALVRPALPAPTGGLAAMISCDEEQRSFEDPELKSGVFLNQLVKGVAGAADLTTASQPADGQITLDELHNYVAANTYDIVQVRFRDKQRPVLLGSFRAGVPVVSLEPPEDQLARAALDALASNMASQAAAARNAGGVPGVGGPGVGNGQQASAAPSGTETEGGLQTALVPIEGGSFNMGTAAPDGDSDERPPVAVRLSDFFIGPFEVTQGEWVSVMGTTPWRGKPNVPSEDPSLPATYVSWDDAVEFCQKFTQSERAAGRLPPDMTYDLPTEAQWEFAARAGTTTLRYFPDPADLGDHAWFTTNAGSVADQRFAHLIGLKKGNVLELFDMYGNVREWCRDRYRATLEGGTDPEGPENTSFINRVTRGGGWTDPADMCRSADRRPTAPDTRAANIGFRLCLHSVKPAE